MLSSIIVLMPRTIFLDIPEDLSFRATVYSHGWCELAPFELDDVNWRLSYVFSGSKGGVTAGTISEDAGRLRIDVANSKVPDHEILSITRHLLRLDENLSDFYETLAGHDRLSWVS